MKQLALGLVIIITLLIPSLAIPAKTDLVDRDSTPFLLTPPNSPKPNPSPPANHDDHATSTEEPASSSTAAAASTTDDRHSSTTSSLEQKTKSTISASSTVSSDSSTTSSEANPSSSSSESPLSSSSTSGVPQDEAKQMRSIEYLIPLFLLVIVTVCGYIYSRWYARRRRRRAQQQQRQTGGYDHEPDDAPVQRYQPTKSLWNMVRAGSLAGRKDERGPNHQWQHLEDEKDDTEPPFDAEVVASEWQDVELRSGRGEMDITEIRSSERLLDSSGDMTRGLGGLQTDRSRWKSTFDVWRSAKRRGIQGDSVGELGERSSTMKLVSSASGAESSIEPPTAPGWIRPSVASPTQLLSPPLQPHLFFHATEMRPSDTSGTLGMISESGESETLGGDSDTDERPHGRFPTIPSSATALASSNGYNAKPYTALPARSPRTPKSARSTNATPTRTQSTMKRSSGTLDLSRTNTRSPSPTPTKQRSGLSRSPAKMYNSSPCATPQLLVPLNSPLLAGLSPRPSTRSTKKSRVERKQDRAQETVNEILQASWSDRLLSSPPPPSITGMVMLNKPTSSTYQPISVDDAKPKFNRGSSCLSGLTNNTAPSAYSAVSEQMLRTTSPGVGQAAVMEETGGGIESRLAMLRRLGG